MLVQFVVVSFATFIGWQILRSVVWFQISARLANFIVPAMAYGITFLGKPSLIVALASAGGCALIHRFIDIDSIEPLRLENRLRFRRQIRKYTPEKSLKKSDKNRIPRL